MPRGMPDPTGPPAQLLPRAARGAHVSHELDKGRRVEENKGVIWTGRASEVRPRRTARARRKAFDAGRTLIARAPPGRQPAALAPSALTTPACVAALPRARWRLVSRAKPGRTGRTERRARGQPGRQWTERQGAQCAGAPVCWARRLLADEPCRCAQSAGPLRSRRDAQDEGDALQGCCWRHGHRL